MKVFSKSSLILALGMGLAFLPSVPLAAHSAGWFQSGDRYRGDRYGDLRGLVEQTQTDLSEASHFQRFKGDQRSRFENAQRHLSTFDRHLTKGKFDKGELDDAISNVQKIIDKNTLQASSRDALMRDVSDLRAARERRH